MIITIRRDMNHPGIRLKILREAKGLTHKQLVKMLYPERIEPVELLLLRAWEIGRPIRLHNELLIKLSKFFNVEIAYLLGW